MPVLTILIRYIALLHHQPDGLTVLFPSARHDLHIEHPRLGHRPIPIRENGDIVLLRNGEPYRGQKVEQESQEYLVHLDKIAGSRVPIRRDILLEPAHEELNGRLLLSGGRVSARRPPHSAPQFGGRRWTVVDSYTPELTDTVEYSVSLDDGSRWELAIPGVGRLDVADGVDVVVANADRPAPYDGYGDPVVLHEFRALYELADHPDKDRWPLPELHNPPPPPDHRHRVSIMGPSRPMCSPAQSGGNN